jgi:hypothetical protein
VPRMRCPPAQGLKQNLQTMPAVQPSKQPIQTGVRKLFFPSIFTFKKTLIINSGLSKVCPVFSRERSSTGSNDCFVVVVVVVLLLLVVLSFSHFSLKVFLCRAMAHFVPSRGT